MIRVTGRLPIQPPIRELRSIHPRISNVQHHLILTFSTSLLSATYPTLPTQLTRTHPASWHITTISTSQVAYVLTRDPPRHERARAKRRVSGRRDVCCDSKVKIRVRPSAVPCQFCFFISFLFDGFWSCKKAGMRKDW